jgi:beta-alanine--pyruvate transaminase
MDARDALWMPFTANRAFKKDPKIITGASGMILRDEHGHELIDAAAGLWCVNAGHGRKQIAEAVAHQIETLDYSCGFQLGTPGAFALAEKIKALLPKGFGSVFFTNSGSESADTALKIALAYHQAKGDGRRTLLVGRARGYHGTNFGGLSVGGLPKNRKQFGPLLGNVTHIRDTHDPARNAFSKGQPDHGTEFADDLNRVIAVYGADTIAAVIVEPMAGSGGVLIPPKGYLERLATICKAHGILLIFDEVITGFGRMAAAFGSERYGVTPDIITMAKGLTNGVIPMGAVACREGIRDTIFDAADAGIELFHGYTYSGHPVASAAALATLKIYEDEDLFGHAAKMAPILEAAVHSLKQSPAVIDIRNDGLVAGIEVEPDEHGPGHRGQAIFNECFKRGVAVRFSGDIIALSPPLIVEEGHIDRIVTVLGEAIRAVA